MLSNKLSILALSVLSLVALLFLAGQVLPAVRPGRAASDWSPAASAAFQITIVGEDTESVRDTVLQTRAAEKGWQQKIAFSSPESEWSGWVMQLEVKPSFDLDTSRYIENPVQVPAQTEVVGSLLIRSGWNQPHDLRLIFMLDFEQMEVLQSGEAHQFHDLPVMEPQENRGLEFVIPALSQGFYQLSIIFVTDPNSMSDDKTYRALQQKSFVECRYDLWVGIEKPPEEIVHFADQLISQAAADRVSNIQLIVPPEGPADELLTDLTSEPGQILPLAFRFFNCGEECRKRSQPDTSYAYDDPVPLRLAVFWDDKMEQVLDYDLLADAADYLILDFKTKAPTELGTHQFNVMAFTFPGYSQFDEAAMRIAYPQGLFGQRVTVDIQP